MKVSSKKEWERLPREDVSSETISRDRTLRNTDIEDSDGKGKVERGPGRTEVGRKCSKGVSQGPGEKLGLRSGVQSTVQMQVCRR